MFQSDNRTPFDLNFRLGGIPIRIHPFFWVMTLMSGNRDPLAAMSWIIACFVSILIHELGHVVAMRLTGGDGEVFLYGFGGLAIPRGRWRRNLTQEIFICLAGPLAELFLAAAIAFGVLLANGKLSTHATGIGLPSIVAQLPLFGEPSRGYLFGYYLINDLLYISICWALVNLLPVHPLDGGQISRAICTRRHAYTGWRLSLRISLATAAVVVVLAALSGSMYVVVLFLILGFNNYQELTKLPAWQRA